MKKILLILTILTLLLIQGNIFSLARFAPESTYLYLDGTVKNLDSTIRTVANKFVNESQFNPEYKSFKAEIKKAFSGLDLTDEESLKSIGINVNRRSGMIMVKYDPRNPPGEFFVALAVDQPKLCRDFLMTLYKKNQRNTKDKILYYKNNIINIIQKKKYRWEKKADQPNQDEYKDDFILTSLGGYILFSNSAQSIRNAIDRFNSKNNLANSPVFQNAATKLNTNNQLMFVWINNEFINFVQKTMSMFTGYDGSNNKIKDLYKYVAMTFNGNDKEMIINTISSFNKSHALYSDIIKIYQSKYKTTNLMLYLPDNPYFFMKASFDAQKAIKIFLPLYPDIQKDFESGLDEGTRELNFDLRSNIIDNLGNHYNFLVYDYEPEAPDIDSDQFLKSLDFFAYCEVQDVNKLNDTLNFFIDKFERSNTSPEVNLTQDDIEGIKVYVFSDANFSFYFGAYQGHFIITTLKERFAKLIRNVQSNNKVFADLLESSHLTEEINDKMSFNLFIDLKRLYDDKKYPKSWLQESIKLNEFKYLHVYGGIQGDDVISTFKLTFN